MVRMPFRISPYPETRPSTGKLLAHLQREADRRRLVGLARAKGAREVQKVLLPRLVHPDRLAEPALVETILQMAGDTGVDAFARQQEAIIARPDSRPR